MADIPEILIDPSAGFCFGVDRAVKMAEEYLSGHGKLLALGSLVHNESEVERLSDRGLEVIHHEQLSNLKNNTVLLRAHGEPPDTYREAAKNNITLLDGTCPVVLKLQEKIARSWEKLQKTDGQLIIVGKKRHPEVAGLNGKINGKALIVENEQDLEEIRTDCPTEVYSQTTIMSGEYDRITKLISDKMAASGNSGQLIIHRSVCGQVAGRDKKLAGFSRSVEVMIFVSGKNSSNGKALFEVCRRNQPASYKITVPDDIRPEWFSGKKKIGISGATSTPVWLLEKVKERINTLVCI
ncbi:MAG: 4-hydroxy-3-methylbut-2-enyl diphosphate reductase [Bacteroidales bacterium]